MRLVIHGVPVPVGTGAGVGVGVLLSSAAGVPLMYWAPLYSNHSPLLSPAAARSGTAGATFWARSVAALTSSGLSRGPSSVASMP